MSSRGRHTARKAEDSSRRRVWRSSHSSVPARPLQRWRPPGRVLPCAPGTPSGAGRSAHSGTYCPVGGVRFGRASMAALSRRPLFRVPLAGPIAVGCLSAAMRLNRKVAWVIVDMCIFVRGATSLQHRLEYTDPPCSAGWASVSDQVVHRCRGEPSPPGSACAHVIKQMAASRPFACESSGSGQVAHGLPCPPFCGRLALVPVHSSPGSVESVRPPSRGGSRRTAWEAAAPTPARTPVPGVLPMRFLPRLPSGRFGLQLAATVGLGWMTEIGAARRRAKLSGSASSVCGHPSAMAAAAEPLHCGRREARPKVRR
jgi:hypothetical protein